VKIGVPKESANGERRVALVPDVVKSLKKNEHVEVLVQSGAGDAAGHPDSQYAEAGAEVVEGDVTWGADVVLRVAAPSSEEIGRLNSSQIFIGHLSPWTAADSNRALAAAGVTSFAMEAIPRTTRAQAMDALSSQAAAAGYAAMLIAAALMFAPIVFVHPLRVERLRIWTIAATAAWFVFAALAIVERFEANVWVKLGLIVMPPALLLSLAALAIVAP